jgi:eukaryotic-like serine/threonine-protein kinase
VDCVTVEFAVGDTIANRYVVERRLGRGGDAVVFAVLDGQTRQRQALKVARRKDITVSLRFRREAALLGRLDMPTIPHCQDVGVLSDGRDYLATDYVDGVTLDVAHRQRPLTIAEILVCCATAARTLGYVHAQGVIHRDVKPTNLIVPIRGSAMVLSATTVVDFGMAKMLSTDVEEPRTATGTWSGTPLYMAPEQLLGRPQSRATDVFGLGATMHELLYGFVPMGNVSPLQQLVYAVNGEMREVIIVPARLDSEAVVPTRLDCPHSVHDLVEDCVRLQPADRIQAMDVVLERIKTALCDLDSSYATVADPGEQQIVAPM